MKADTQPIQPPVTKKNLFFWAFHKNLKLQLLLLVLIAVMVIARVIPLEMQKRIVNEAIVLKKLDQLLVYCAIYLLAVTITGVSKLCVNYLQARIGEQAILRMRTALYSHIISLPLLFFRNTQPGVVVASLMTELASAGTFAGMALAAPVANILTLLAFAGYLLWLHPQLALCTLAIYPIVVIFVPYLQKKANRLNKKRVDQSRLVASQITESITGIHEINVHGAYSIEKRKFDQLVEHLQSIRLKWSLFRFSIKSTNNYFVNLGPFIVFIFGGYLVMNGQLALGSMVAFLSAQEKLYDPWKELIEFYQVYQDASVRYQRTMQSFDIPSMPLLTGQAMDSVSIHGALELSNVGYTVAEGKALLQQVTLSLQPGQHLALVGFSGSGKSTLVQCLAKMFSYTSGSIKLDGIEIKNIPKSELIKHVGYISQHPFIFSGSVLDNLLYAHHSVDSKSGVEKKTFQSPHLDHLILSLQQAGFFVDVIRFGLETAYENSTPAVTSKLITMREKFRRNSGTPHERYIEFYDHKVYLQYSTILDNITFAVSRDTESTFTALFAQSSFIDFLSKHNLIPPLLALGKQIAKLSVEYHLASKNNEKAILATPISVDAASEYVSLVSRLDATPHYELSIKEQHLLLKTALLYAPGIHSSFSMPPGLEARILSVRPHWKQLSNREYTDLFTYLKKDEPIQGRSVFNNILFGKMKTDETLPNEQVNQAIIRLLIEEDCLEDVAEAGMEYNVGNMGDKLSGGQKQKLAIARVLLKEPKVILMDEATSALDNKSQARIQRLIERWKGKRTVIAVVHRLDTIQHFDAVGVMKSGKLVEYGTYKELMRSNGVLHELVTGKTAQRRT
ncbi:ABC transporter ATP-binding protein/permease [Desulfogranum marinum]|uniref:ABC transporter ATP-binding protein/permease n=1 Tax=Desulfogranum marinum TaxID=453220 RepID=UPI0029C901EF|nr:ABC transporter ATP-binding protein/permease [Desulfogranum marinum]